MPDYRNMFGAPIVDFSSLGQLGNTFIAARDAAEKRQREQQLQAELKTLGDMGKLDPTTMGMAALKTGNLQAALTAAQLAQAQSDRQFSQGIQERQVKVLERKPVQPGYRETPTGMEVIPGGPEDPETLRKQAIAKAKGEETKPLPAEMAARIALGQQFMDKYPGLLKEVGEGGVTGFNRGWAELGRGRQGEILREIKSGSEAIVRNLTGAGMPESEARQRVKQYEPTYIDDAPTVVSKLKMMNDQLQRMEAEAYRGRGIPKVRREKGNPYFEPVGTAVATGDAGGATAGGVGTYSLKASDLQEGKLYEDNKGRKFRFISGQRKYE